MKIGIMGGTFDPIHIGHISCAREVKNKLNLDKILFIPTGEPPHKISRLITSAEHRLEMVRLAIEKYDYFDVSDIEVKRKNYTYTYDTIKELKSVYCNDDFYMIIGADTLADIVNWYKALEVFALCRFIAMKRPGANYDLFESYLKIAMEAGADVIPVDIPEINVSSTDIRERIERNEGISELVPRSVEEYIISNDLFQNKAMSYDDISRDMQKLLSVERYEHCINVAEECIRLGKIYGVEESKCRLAGLLHDVGKELTDKQYHWMGIELSNDNYNGEKVLRHGVASKILAMNRYGINNEEILEAIECHITGKPNMGLLSKIVFIADYTEKDRVGMQYDAVREKANAGLLNEAVLLQCDNTLIYNLKRGCVHICTQTVQTRNWILSMLQKKEV